MSSEGCERTLKVVYGGDTRRGKLVMPQDEAPADVYNRIRSAVATLFEATADKLCLKYEDEEGDLCTLTENTITDFLSFAPTGALRLRMEIRTPEAAEPTCEGNVDATPTAGNVDATKTEADRAESSGPDAPTSSASTDSANDSLRMKIRALCEKVGVGELQMALAFVESMDATAMHAMLPMLLQLLAVAQPTELTTLQQMQQMEPESLKALVLEELRSQVDEKASGASAGEGGNVPPQNPLEAMLGTFLAGKGMGKGVGACNPAHAPATNPWDMQGNAQHNPLEQLIGAALAGKGMGKGTESCPTACAPGMNPLDVLGMLARKGAGGKGSKGTESCPTACAPGMNPLDVLGMLARKGAGSKGSYMPEPVPPATVPSPEGAPPAPTPVASPSPASDADPAARTAFDESVDDLLNMGLVSDRQMARELLTAHGDISTVVAVLTAE